MKTPKKPFYKVELSGAWPRSEVINSSVWMPKPKQGYTELMECISQVIGLDIELYIWHASQKAYRDLPADSEALRIHTMMWPFVSETKYDDNTRLLEIAMGGKEIVLIPIGRSDCLNLRDFVKYKEVWPERNTIRDSKGSLIGVFTEKDIYIFFDVTHSNCPDVFPNSLFMMAWMLQKAFKEMFRQEFDLISIAESVNGWRDKPYPEV